MNIAAKHDEFNEWAAAYDSDVREDGLFPFDGYSQVLEQVLAQANVSIGMEVLELGPGTGNLTARLVSQGAVVWGLDFSAEMLAIARQKVPQAHFDQADLLGEYPGTFRRSYDRVVATYVFHEFPLADKITLLKRLFAQYLTPEGFVVIGDIGFPDAATRDRVKNLAGDRWDEEYYWLADETQATFPTYGLAVDYEQISTCGVVFVIRHPHNRQ